MKAVQTLLASLNLDALNFRRSHHCERGHFSPTRCGGAATRPKKSLVLAALALGVLGSGWFNESARAADAFTFTSGNLTYNENFDSMGSSSASYVPGWTAIRAAGSGTVGATLT